MNLFGAVRRGGGLARTSELLALGHTPRDLRRAVSGGRLIRPARGWIAFPEADSDLIFAARFHVLLSCVTQAKRAKLWVREQPVKKHVAVHGPNAKVRSDTCVVHWHKPWVLRPPYTLVDPVENVLQCVAACQPFESALVIWESAMNAGHVDAARLSTLPLSSRARKILELCTPFSDSGLESLVVSRLRWLPVPVRQQIMVHGHRVDVLIGARLVLQIDGATHTGTQRDADTRHDAELEQMGYHVIRVGYRQIMQEWEMVQGLVLAAIARGRHLAQFAPG